MDVVVYMYIETISDLNVVENKIDKVNKYIVFDTYLFSLHGENSFNI